MSLAKSKTAPPDLPLSGQLVSILKQADTLAKRAKGGRKALSGNNYYAETFHSLRVEAMRLFKEVKPKIEPLASPSLIKTIDDVEAELDYFFTPTTTEADRRDLRKEIEELLVTEIDPAAANSEKAETEFIPTEILENTTKDIEKIVKQVNKCFQSGTYDACGVMTRKLIETLIIEVFERKGIVAEIMDADNNYFLFKKLVTKLINTKETRVGRTVRKELPAIADVLNNCAHNRRFHIVKPQLVQYQSTITIAIQELVSLATF